MDDVQARVEERDGQLVLVDPAAMGLLAAVQTVNRRRAKEGCSITFRANGERIAHFVRRIEERGQSSKDVVIVLVRVDDSHGGPLSEELMPGYDWAPVRSGGAIPYARGLAMRDGIEDVVKLIDPEVGVRFRTMTDAPVVVVVDFETCDVFYASQVGA